MQRNACRECRLERKRRATCGGERAGVKVRIPECVFVIARGLVSFCRAVTRLDSLACHRVERGFYVHVAERRERSNGLTEAIRSGQETNVAHEADGHAHPNLGVKTKLGEAHLARVRGDLAGAGVEPLGTQSAQRHDAMQWKLHTANAPPSPLREH